MEWMNRGARQNTAPSASSGAATQSQTTSKKKTVMTPGARMFNVALLFSITVLLAAFVAYIILGGGGNKGEGRFVDGKKMQAVFLNGGQVYFGNITNLSGGYMRLANIYYLRVNQQVQPNQQSSQNQQQTDNNISLVKLGCELHGPEDAMVINREQVIFWENLKDDGQVVEAVKKYVKDNPNGQECAKPSAQSNTQTQQTQQSTNATQQTTQTQKKQQ